MTLSHHVELFGYAYGLGEAMVVALEPCLSSLKQVYGTGLSLAQMNLQSGVDHHCLPELLQEGLQHLLLKEALLHHESCELQEHIMTWSAEDFSSPV